MFNLHRLAADTGLAWIAAMLGESDVVAAMLQQFRGQIDLGSHEAVIATHPWTGKLIGVEAARQGADAAIVECHAEFSRFPVFADARVDAYFGAGELAPNPTAIRKRCHTAGIPIRSSFIPARNARSVRRRQLVVNAGASGWLIARTAVHLPLLVEALQPDTVNLLAPSEAAVDEWERRLVGSVPIANEMTIGSTDVGDLLCSSRWLLTKAGGTPVAEGLAAGCEVYSFESGVPWEDEALTWLAARYQVVAMRPNMSVDELRLAGQTVAATPRTTAHACRVAANVIWTAIERGQFTQEPEPAAGDLTRLLHAALGGPRSTVPLISTAAAEVLRRWLPDDER